MSPLQFEYQLKQIGRQASAGLVLGGGTNAAPMTTAVASKNFLDFRSKSTATSGDSRGLYLRHYLSGSGIAGEAARLFATVDTDTPGTSSSCHGTHSSLSFGNSAGNLTGTLGAALRSTLHVPNRSLAGTHCGVMSEYSSDGASSANGGTASFFRAVLSGNATGAAAIEDNINLFEVVSGTNASGNVVGALNGNEPTWAGKTGLIRVRLNGTTAYIPVVTL